MNWKQFVNAYFSFTKKERQGTFIVVIIIFLLVISVNFLPYIFKQEQPSYNDFRKEIALLSVENTDSIKNNYSYKHSDNNNKEYVGDAGNDDEPVKRELFYFDPNTATFNDWKRLGLKDKTIHTIQNYLSKGGKFYKPDDIRKIWGLSPKDADLLIPYISIKSEQRETGSSVPESKKDVSATKTYAKKTISIIDINTADTSQLISLPGIGRKLSARIIAFRNKLGGFYSINQVAETYMLPDSVFQKIKPMLTIGELPVKQININTATVDEMKAHPYLRYNLANAIFQYRQQHGSFNSVEDLKKIMMITAETYDKIAPYLTVK